MNLIFSALGALAFVLGTATAWAQSFPAPGRTVRVIIGFPPGGGTDIQARLVAPKFSEALGVPVVVENKPGASTMLAAADVARSAPDGYTILYTFSGAFAQNPHTFAKIPYDPFKDFTPISQGARGPLLLVAHPSLPANNVRELIAYAKANPGLLNYASFGSGTSAHINGEMLRLQAGINIVHVPYKGGADAMKDLMTGRVHIMFDTAATGIAYAKSGKLKILGVVAESRVPMLPDVPTITEQGVPGIDILGWLGFFGPANMPADVVRTLNAALVKALGSPEVREAFLKGGYEAISSTPAGLAAVVKDSYDRWGKVVKQIGLKVE